MEIARQRIFKEYQRIFSRFLGLKLTFIDIKEVNCGSENPKKAYLEALRLKIPQILQHGNGLRLIIPVIANEEISGLLLTENVRPSFSNSQIKALSDLLSLTINCIAKAHFDPSNFKETDGPLATRAQKGLIKAIEYIKKNFHQEDISLKKVATEVCLSQYYFSHIFKKELGMNFIEYLTRVRLEEAAKLLNNPGLNINQIAFAVGYQDPAYFSKLFKKHKKISPLNYRNNKNKKNNFKIKIKDKNKIERNILD